MTCIGITATKKKCHNKVLSGNYCHYHKFQEKVTPLIVDHHNQDNQIGENPCSICLDNVEDEQNCNLICNHPHHTACIKQLIKPYCPICNHPLEFKTSNKIIDTINKKAAKEKILKAKEQMESDNQLAKELEQETPINLPYKEDELLTKILEESLLTAEIEDYERAARLAEESYYFAQKEDEILLERVMKENIEINKHDWCDEDFKTLMKGQKQRIIRLK